MTAVVDGGIVETTAVEYLPAEQLTACEAVAITGRIREWVRAYPIDDIQRAFFGRVWVAMGYESWGEWCDCELDGFKLPVVERREVVAELSEGGMSNRSIADVIGVHHTTVGADLASSGGNPPVDEDRKTVGQDGKVRPASRNPKGNKADQLRESVEIDADQALREAELINALNAMFRRNNIKKYSKAARQMMADSLETAAQKIRESLKNEA